LPSAAEDSRGYFYAAGETETPSMGKRGARVTKTCAVGFRDEEEAQLEKGHLGKKIAKTGTGTSYSFLAA